MRQLIWASMLLSGVVAIVPHPVEAQLFRRPFKGCCETCTLPQAECSCSQTRAVVQTQMHARQVTTFRDVTETQFRNETVVQNVPVTTYKQVTVDEGGYQMVWVPKPVTKQVAQTVIQQQAQSRVVPYQVTRRVPQVSTQLVPVQTVHHVTETVPMMSAAAPVMFQAAAGSCNTCNGGFGTAFAPTVIAPQYNTAYAAPILTAPITVAPAPQSVQTMPAIQVPLPQTAQGPLPPPVNSTEQWQTIPSRPSASSSPYESRSVPVPMDDARNVVPRATRLTPTPSAATVWGSRPAH